jgi:MOSC domain-containing protein YiiM
MKKVGKIMALNISEQKGIMKHTVDEVKIDMLGIVGDTHAGTNKRQISLLSYESIQEFTKRTKTGIKSGDFAENIIVSGIDFKKVVLGDIFKINDVMIAKFIKK